MLTYIDLTIKNDPYTGCIKIESVHSTSSIGSVNKIKITKSISGASGVDSSVLKEIEINDIEDMDFSLIDYLVLSGKTYTYIVDVMSDNAIVEFQVFNDIQCYFEGLFIGNSEQQFIAGTNFKTDLQKNMEVEYVNTLSGKYPMRVSNSDFDYFTGTSSGLFMELSADKKKFIPDNYYEYAQKVMAFLCDGTPKILKTHDGLAFCIGVDKAPKFVQSDYMGMHPIEFSWTEIDELPNSL